MEISFYNQWVDNGADFAEGVAYYTIHGDNDTLKALFTKGDNYYNRMKLRAELQNLKVAVAPKEPAVTEIPEDFKTFRVPVKRINPDLLPDVLKTEYYKLGPLINQIRFLHAKLDTENEEQRCAYALKIVENSSIRRSIFNKIDEYLATGKLPIVEEKPTPVAVQDLSVYQLKEELLLLRSRRSKLKKRLDRSADYESVLARICLIEKEMEKYV
jgi:hypothetical protein